MDCGSTGNLLSDRYLYPGLKLSIPFAQVRTLGKQPIPLVGAVCRVQISKGPATLGVGNFLVTSTEMRHFDGILGMPFLKSIKGKLDFASDALLVGSFSVPCCKKMSTRIHSCQIEPGEFPNELEAMTAAVNEESIQLTAAFAKTWPPNSQGFLQVKCLSLAYNKTLIFEPTTLSNGLVVGGAALIISSSQGSCLPAMNVVQEPVTVKWNASVGYAYVLKDPRLIIGPEEQYSREEYSGLTAEEAWAKEENWTHALQGAAGENVRKEPRRGRISSADKAGGKAPRNAEGARVATRDGESQKNPSHK